MASDYLNLEIILVDNGSSDGSIDYVTDLLDDPRVKLLRLRANSGYATACNRGSKLASGSILAFLNVDITVTPGWLQPLVSLFSNDPTVGVVQPKLVLKNSAGVVDAAGGFIDIFGCAHERNQLPSGPVGPDEIFYAKGAAIVISAPLFFRLGKFDEDFFLYYEETDLCWRVWLSGHRVMYVPNSVVFHARAGIVSPLIANLATEFYFIARMNRFRMILKNYEMRYLLVLVPFILLNQFKDLVVLIILGSTSSALRATLKVPWAVLRNLKRVWQRRLVSRQLVRVSNRQLIGRVILPVGPFFIPHEIGDLPLSRRGLGLGLFFRRMARLQ